MADSDQSSERPLPPLPEPVYIAPEAVGRNRINFGKGYTAAQLREYVLADRRASSEAMEVLRKVARAAKRMLTTASQVVTDMDAQSVLIEWITETEEKCAALRAALEELNKIGEQQ